MAYTYTELDNDELLVEDESKGIRQIIPAIKRPYNLIYIPSKDMIMGTNDLDVGVEFQHIKVVK